MDKAALRTEMRRRIAALPPAQRAREEGVVAAAVQADPAWAAARTLLLYHHKGPEFSVVALANGAWRGGKRVLFPRVEGDSLALREAVGWHDLAPGAFGILEPHADRTRADPATVDVAVVPGLAWTAAGQRLGQGGGFYDRLLPMLGGAAWGVGFDCQLLDGVPLAPHDRGVTRVWTAKQVLDQY